MKSKPLLSVFLIIMMLTVSGCSFTADSESLLKPPKITGREADIENLVEEASGGDYQLKYPRSGSYRSAIIIEDFNADSDDEAIAFFRTGGNDAIHMLVMCSDGGGWNICRDFTTSYTAVDCVVFADYDLDGSAEILVGFAAGDGCELNVFDIDTAARTADKADFTAPYAGFTTGDFDRDGGSEILIFTLQNGENPARATLTDYDGTLYTLSECSMDPSVVKYENIVSGMLGESTVGAAVDGTLENGYSTQVVYYDDDKNMLVNYPYTSQKKPAQVIRSYNVYSRDIDSDGYLEIPLADSSTVMLENENNAPVINWSRLNTKKAKPVSDLRCVNNFEYNYYFNMPDYFYGMTAATLSDDNRTMEIYTVDGGEKDSLLLTIKVFDVGASVEKTKGYTTLESYNQYIYAYKIGDTSTLYADDDIVRENFALNDSV